MPINTTVRSFPPKMKAATVCRIMAISKGLHVKARGVIAGNKHHAKQYRDSVKFRIPSKEQKRMAYSFANSRSLDRFLGV
jgi:hypothetical protein